MDFCYQLTETTLQLGEIPVSFVKKSRIDSQPLKNSPSLISVEGSFSSNMRYRTTNGLNMQGALVMVSSVPSWK